MLFLLTLVTPSVQADHGPDRSVEPAPERVLADKKPAAFYWLDDPAGQMSLQEAIERFNRGGLGASQTSLGRGFTLKTSWLHLTLTAAELAVYDYLWLEPSHLNEVDLYYPTLPNALDATSYQKVALGDHTPAAERPYQHFRALFPLERIRNYQAYPGVNRQDKYQIYIRVRTNGVHALNPRLLTDEAMVADSSRYLLFYASFTGIAFILGAFSLFIALRLRDKVYLWYACYLFSIMAAYLPITGVLSVLLDHAPRYLSDILTGGGTGLGFACLSILSIHLLSSEGRTVNIGLRWYLYFTAALGVMQVLSSPFDLYSSIAGFNGVNASVFAVVLMLSFAGRVLKGSASDRFIFSALTLTVMGVLINFCRLMGWLPENILTIHAFQVTSLLHMLLLNQAFAERVMMAERKAVEAARESEQRANARADDKNRKLIVALEKEQTARESQERFFDMISHEYRTPLSILKTNLEILELKEPVNWGGRHNLCAMQQAVDRLQEVFDKSLQGVGWKESALQAEQRMELVALFDHFVDEAHLMWSQANLEYQVQLDHAWYKHLDPTLMKTVVFNLIDNARKYTQGHEAVRISLSADAAGKALVFEVRNAIQSASGFEHGALASKFTRGANSAGTSGLGVGLSLVQQILALTDDRLELEEQKTCFVARVILSAEAVQDEGIYSIEY